MTREDSLSFSQLADQFDEQSLLITLTRQISFAEALGKTAHIAHHLRRRGVENGERVAILAANCPEYVLLLLALWKIGAVAVVLSTRFPKARLSELLAAVDCRKLVTTADRRDSLPDTFPQGYFLEDLLRASSIGWSKQVGGEISLRRDATIMFTSGSSGEPKAVLHTFANHYYNARGSQHNIPFQVGDRWLVALPLYHVGGLAILFRALLGGGAMAIPESRQPLGEALPDLGVTHVSLVATQLFRLLREPQTVEHLRRLKAILLGGSAIPPALIRMALGEGLAIHTSYGSTEMASQITTTPPGAEASQLLTSGKLLPHRKLRIAGDGEILVKGDTLFRGYVTGEGFDPRRNPQGWFHTGDMGRWDATGNLAVTGRKDHMFISGGENIQPEEIEQTLGRMPGIEQVIVVAVEDAEFGRRPAAFVQWRKGERLDEASVRRFLTERLPRFKIPDYFFPWPDSSFQSDIKPSRSQFQRLAETYRQQF